MKDGWAVILLLVVVVLIGDVDGGGVQMTKLQSSLLNEDPSHIFRMELPLSLLSE